MSIFHLSFPSSFSSLQFGGGRLWLSWKLVLRRPGPTAWNGWTVVSISSGYSPGEQQVKVRSQGITEMSTTPHSSLAPKHPLYHWLREFPAEVMADRETEVQMRERSSGFPFGCKLLRSHSSVVVLSRAYQAHSDALWTARQAHARCVMYPAVYALCSRIWKHELEEVHLSFFPLVNSSSKYMCLLRAVCT